MSGSQIISRNNGKIFDELLPNPYPYPAQANDLASVLVAGNQAGDQDIVGVNNLQATIVDNPLLGGSLTIGGAGQDLRITGATTKGSILAGNGTSTIELPVGANGLVLKANSATATGLEWGADASGGTVEAVNAGTNISVGGTISQPIVNLASPLTSTLGMGTVALTDKVGASGTAGQFLSAGTGGETLWATPPDTLPTLNAGTNITISGTQANPTIAFATPTTSDIQIGVGTQIIAKDDYTTPIYTLSLDATGLNDTFLSGAVENKEDISVSATSVIDTISTTDGSSYLNTNITTCNTSGITDVKTSTNLSNSSVAQASISCNATGATPSVSMGCGVSAPTSPPFPDQSASVSMGCSDTSNPTISLSQDAPFLPSYSTIINKDGIVQNNSSGAGFSIQSAQDVSLLPTSNLILTAGNIDLNASGRLVCPSLASTNYFDYNTGKLTIVNNSVAGSANPLLVLQNNNNTAGAITLETYKNDAPTSTGGDVISAWSSYCNTTTGSGSTKTELTRISSVANGVGLNNNDGSIALACKVNSSANPQNFLICNGGVAPSGEIQVFKPISTTSGNNIDISCPTPAGSINLTSVSNVNITATGDNLTMTAGSGMLLETTGTGTNIEFKPETTAGGIVFTGTALQSATSGGFSGEHLVITLNGVQYKIRLETP